MLGKDDYVAKNGEEYEDGNLLNIVDAFSRTAESEDLIEGYGYDRLDEDIETIMSYMGKSKQEEKKKKRSGEEEPQEPQEPENPQEPEETQKPKRPKGPQGPQEPVEPGEPQESQDTEETPKPSSKKSVFSKMKSKLGNVGIKVHGAEEARAKLSELEQGRGGEAQMARASNGFLANRAAGYLTEEEKRRLDAEVVGSPITLSTGKVVTFTQDEIDEFRKSGKTLGAFLREKGLTKEEAQELKEKTDVAYVVSDRTETQGGKTYRKRNIASYNQLTGKEVGTTGIRLELSDVDFDGSGLDNIDRNDIKSVVATQIRTTSDGSIHATARITTSEGSYEAELTLNSLPKSMQQSATNTPQFARAEGGTPSVVNQEELNEIKAKAIANGTFKKAPNGEPTRLTERQWLQVRTKAFKAWFGDWILGELRNYLLGSNYVKVLTGNEFEKDGTPLTEKVTAYYKTEYNGIISRDGFGEVVLDHRGVKDSLSHGIGRLKSIAFAAVPEIISKGRIIDSQSEYKGRNQDSFTFGAPIQIGDKGYVGIVVVTRGKGTDVNRFYLHEVILQENLHNESFKTDTKADSHHGDLANVLKRIISAIDSSKVVDENGEPKVVYHTTSENFTVFDRDRARANMDVQAMYFSEGQSDWEGMGENAMPVFLNLRNPAAKPTVDTRENNGGVKAREELEAQGYDGTIMSEEGMETEYAVFNPTQIKSATENNGEFSSTNPDIRFMKSDNGEVLGFELDGEIYVLDETFWTYAHEYTHVWDKAVRRRRPELCKRGVQLMKRSKLWNQVEDSEQYGKKWKAQGKTGEELENLIASEVHSRLVGEEGARIIDEQKGDGKDVVAKLKKWIKDTWKALAQTFGTWTQEDIDRLTIDDFNHMTIRDFVEGTRLNEQGKVTVGQPKSVTDQLIDNLSSAGIKVHGKEEAQAKLDELEQQGKLDETQSATVNVMELAKLAAKANVGSVPKDMDKYFYDDFEHYAKGGNLTGTPFDGYFKTPDAFAKYALGALKQAFNVLQRELDKGLTWTEAFDNLKPDQVMIIGMLSGLFLSRMAQLYREQYGNRKQSTSIQFARAEDANEKFNRELQQQIDGTLPEGHIYNLGMPGAILLSTGIANAPIQLSAEKLRSKSEIQRHLFDLSEIKDLVYALQNPIAVFAYGDKSKAQNVIVEIQHEGKNFLIGISILPTVKGKVLEINSIRNVFPKDNAEWLNWVSEGKTLYCDKEKIQTLIDQQRMNLADVSYLDLDDVANIVKDFENPKLPEEKSSTNPDIRFMKADNGSVLGFEYNGEIYLLSEDPSVLAHEYTHVWDRVIQQKFPELWKQGVSLIKQTSLWQQVENEEAYGKKWKAEGKTAAELENLIASEVHSRLVGEEGARIIDEQKGDGKGIVAKLKKWIKDTWKALAQTFGTWTQEDIDSLTLDDFNHMTIRDFVEVTKLNGQKKVTVKQVEHWLPLVGYASHTCRPFENKVS